MEEHVADVLIVGAGPIGGLTAYQLARFKCVPYVIERDDKPNMPIYGRATTLWPRTLELYDQLDILQPMLDVGVISRSGYNFKDGKMAPGGLVFGQRMDKHGDTAFKFALHLRQRLSEQVFDDGLNRLGYSIHYRHQLESFTTDESADYPVTATITDLVAGKTYIVRAKYIVAADGAKSTVRKQTPIEFIGERSSAKWIRMDALVKTDMPNSRMLNSIMSKEHGLILFCPIDEGKTRIGYVFNADLQKRYGADGVTEEIAKQEAQRALAPFSLEFVTVDWFTLYGIGQCIASDFVSGRVLLVGDACHSHSSGSAQGLNTGTHDATNLAWKLALVLKGTGSPSLLESYNEERKASVQQVIDNDVIIATLISGNYPPKFAGRTDKPSDILTEWFDNANVQAFTLGLGISYSGNNIVNSDRDAWPVISQRAGERAPDVALSRIGTWESVRLHKVLANEARFNIVIFTGDSTQTVEKLKELRAHVMDDSTSFYNTFSKDVFRFVTVIQGEGIGAEEFLGVKPLGTSYFDPVRLAHEVYGVDPGSGALVVVRPDGIIGTVKRLEEAKELKEYFGGFLV